MPAVLSLNAVDKSTYIVTAAFTDEDGDPVTPNTVAWTLKDIDGNTVNSREDVSETPDTSVEIVLSGADLAPGTSDSIDLFLAVSATYDSPLGSDLPLVEECEFPVRGVK